MSTGEGAGAEGDAREQQGRGPRGDRIGIGGGDDSVTRIQLAARWAETYGSGKDSLTSILGRFRLAYDYLDAVTHGVDPPDLPDEAPAPPQQAPAPAPQYAPAPAAEPAAQYAPAPSQPESRPWG
jgi:hypothetical protein